MHRLGALIASYLLLLSFLGHGAASPLYAPNWVKSEMFFGLSIQSEVNGTVVDSVISVNEFESFVDLYITPFFPSGLTYMNASGQWLSSSGNIVYEPSMYMIVYYEDTSENEQNIRTIVEEYMQQYQQEAVLYTFIPSQVCLTSSDCLSTESRYFSPLVILCLIFCLFNSLLIIALAAFFYIKYQKAWKRVDRAL